jgi:hypothetical protein
MEPRTLSLSVTEIGDLPMILIISYPKRYAPVMFGTILSPFGSGYDISISFDGLLLCCVLIERLFCVVSISTWALLSSLFASTHSFGSETKMLLPIFCRRRVNVTNLYYLSQVLIF